MDATYCKNRFLKISRKNEFLLSKLQKIYYTETDIHIRYKIKVVLALSNYPAKKLNSATGFDTYNLAAKSGFVALKTEVY